MSQAVVVDDVIGETTQLFRAAAGLGRAVADRRRQKLWQLQAEARDKAQAMQRSIEAERRLADPVIRQALNARFWEKASIQEAAQVYGVCSRFAPLDALAQQGALACEREMNTRWGAGLLEGEHAYSQSSLPDPATLGDDTVSAIAPVVGDEDTQGMPALLSEQRALEAADAAQAGAGELQQAREVEQIGSYLSRVLADHPDVVGVEVSTTQGYMDDGKVVDVVAFRALGADGQELADVTQAMHEIVDHSVSPQLFVDRLAGRSFSREAFEEAANRPLLAGASRPAAHVSHTIHRWDSPQAREQWAQQRQAEGIDPAAVRAAVTGDSAMSQPAMTATDPSRYQSAGLRRPKKTKEQGRRYTLS